jgi:VCBS repeat-containing protein
VAGGAAAAAAAGGGKGGGGAAIDTTAPSAPTVALPEAPNGVSAAEAADGTPINVTLPADAVAGDTLTTVVTKPDGSLLTLTHVLTAGDIATKSVVQTITAAELKDVGGHYLDGTWKVASTVTDAAKNVSTPATEQFVLDTSGPVAETTNPWSPGTGKVSLVLDEVPSTDVVSGMVRGEFTPGDVVTLTINRQTYTAQVDASGKFSVPIKHADLVADADKTIDATLLAHDAAGNPGNVAAVKAYAVDVISPTFTSATAALSVNENIPTTTVVYQAKATDTGFLPPATANSIFYSLKADAQDDSGAFVIDSSMGNVTFKTSPNYEVKGSYNFTVVATDAAGNAAEKGVTLAINNVDEVAPTILSSTTVAAVNENTAIGTTIYTVSAVDTDFVAPNTQNSVTYRLKNVDDAAKFTINQSTGDVQLAEVPNYEVKSSYSFTVQAVDAAGNVSEQALTLAINNVAEPAKITFLEGVGWYGGGSNDVSPLTWKVMVNDPDVNQSKLAGPSTAKLVGTYGDFEIVSSSLQSDAGTYNWKYTLHSVSGAVTLSSLTSKSHDLQVIQSLDGSAYQTVDVLVNKDSGATTQLFNTKITLGLVVNGDAQYTDTLMLHGVTGNDLVLDLTDVTSKVATLSSVEHIELMDSQNYTVKLNLGSLLQADATPTGSVHQLTISGTNGDAVVLAHEMQPYLPTTPTSDNGGYDHYVWVTGGNNYELILQQGIQVSMLGS